MTYKQPVYSRLPMIGYQDNLVGMWLSGHVDEALEARATLMSTLWQKLIPETAPSAYLDYLAYLCGLSGVYYDTKWSDSVKRVMIANAHSLWSSRGTIKALTDVLGYHSIPYKLWTSGALRLSFTIPATIGSSDLRLYLRLPIAYSRLSSVFKEAQRTARNYLPVIVDHRVVYEQFTLGFSVLSDPLFSY